MARKTATRSDAAVLQFPHSGKMSGFRSSGISAYNNVDPHTVIRELVQNALDASMLAGREVVRVVFEIEHLPRSAIPARSEYQQHLDSAVATQREIGNLTQAQSIIDAMRASIEASAVPVLWALDNGVGLDDEGMEKLLGDGHSGKADESTAGSYGNGHMTSFPASDLRYVAYGGVHEKGRTVSGHAILASHKLGGTVHGEDGYLAKEIRENDLFGRFEFFDGSEFDVIQNQLDWIEGEFETGSAVGILGFNRFNRYQNDEEVLAIIETVVSTHFTPLIRDGSMEVQLWVDGTPERTVDARALEEILARRKERERRDRNSIGPSGRQAWDMLETLNPEHQHTIETKAGKVRFHFRALPRGCPGGTHLQLFRNGMWITNDVPRNKASDFRHVLPFSGVVLLDPNEARDACALVGAFEGPRHIYIDLTIQRRGSAERRALDEFFRELHERILELVPELESQEYDPGFFSIEVPGDGVRSDPRARAGGAGTPEPVRRREPRVTPRPPRPNPVPDPRPRPTPRPPPRLRRRIEAQVTALKQDGGIRLRVKPLEDAANVELRVVLPDGSDETCDSPAPEQFVEMKKGAQVDGEPVRGYVKDKGGVRRALMLGPVSSDRHELDIWIPCQPTERGDIRVELLRPTTRSGGT
ncbi:MAG: hypothetical protein OXK79_10950 [Chloroflexota bacterium]|nr:hypothetical protein [Chloroflexota bacterium]